MSAQRRRVLEDSKLIIPANGVYIEGLDRKVYTTSSWKGGSAANSVIVASGDVKFRMALTYSIMQVSSDSSDPLENYTTERNYYEATVDYDGAGNTANILKLIPSTGYAAGYCNAFIFPNGKTKGYLPSAGQLYIAYQSKYEISRALKKCGGMANDDADYWSSTFYGMGDGGRRLCWLNNWYDGTVKYYPLDYSLAVRPFANIS